MLGKANIMKKDPFIKRNDYKYLAIFDTRPDDDFIHRELVIKMNLIQNVEGLKNTQEFNMLNGTVMRAKSKIKIDVVIIIKTNILDLRLSRMDIRE